MLTKMGGVGGVAPPGITHILLITIPATPPGLLYRILRTTWLARILWGRRGDPLILLLSKIFCSGAVLLDKPRGPQRAGLGQLSHLFVADFGSGGLLRS